MPKYDHRSCSKSGARTEVMKRRVDSRYVLLKYHGRITDGKSLGRWVLAKKTILNTNSTSPSFPCRQLFCSIATSWCIVVGRLEMSPTSMVGQCPAHVGLQDNFKAR